MVRSGPELAQIAWPEWLLSWKIKKKRQLDRGARGGGRRSARAAAAGENYTASCKALNGLKRKRFHQATHAATIGGRPILRRRRSERMRHAIAKSVSQASCSALCQPTIRRVKVTSCRHKERCSMPAYRLKMRVTHQYGDPHPPFREGASVPNQPHPARRFAVAEHEANHAADNRFHPALCGGATEPPHCRRPTLGICGVATSPTAPWTSSSM